MRKFLLGAALALPLAFTGCGDDKTDEIFDRLIEAQEEIAAGNVDIIFDILWEVFVNQTITGNYSEVETTRHFRLLEGGEPVEQVAYNVDGQDKYTEERTRSSVRTERVYGRGEIFQDEELFRDHYGAPTNVRTFAYFVELNEDVQEEVETRTTVDNGGTPVEEIDTTISEDLVAIIKYYREVWDDFQGPATRVIVVECISGDATPLGVSSCASGDTFFYGVHAAQIGEMWDRAGAYYVATTNETVTLQWNGAATDVTATRVEVRRVGGQDLASEIAAECINRTLGQFTGGSNETVNGFDCPQTVVVATQLWWSDLLIRADQTTVQVQADEQTVLYATDTSDESVGVDQTATDTGLGFELITTCDYDGDGQSGAENCRYTSTTNNNEAVSNFIGQPAISFDGNANVHKYVHYTVTETVSSWEVTRIDDADPLFTLPEEHEHEEEAAE